MPLTGSKRAAQSWAKTVEVVIADLEHMNCASEAGFLAVGGELAQFLSVSRRISSGSGALAESIAGEQGREPCDALQHLLDRLRSKEKRIQSAQQVPTLRASADLLRRCFAGFDGTAFAFKQLATLGGIEIGRLDKLAAGLSQLTEEMRSCSEDIRLRVGQFLETAALLDRRLDSLLTGMAEFDDRQSMAIPPLVNTVGASLEGFRKRLQRSENAARGMGEQFTDLSKAIRDVVVSIQSHDITRQQIEHVTAALKLLTDALNINGDAAVDRDPGPEEVGVLDMQLAQLESVARTFEASISAIDRGLATIAERVEGMAAESTSLVDRSSNESDNFFGELQQSFVAIAEATGDCAALERGAQATLEELGSAIQRLVEALAQIDAVGLKLRLLAINTVIQSRQLGASGEPLKAVAGAVRELQTNCESRSREGSGILQKIGTSISIMGETDSMGPVVQELGARIDELRASAGRSADTCKEISSLATVLSQDVRNSRGNFSAIRSFHETVENSCQALRVIVAEFRNDEEKAGAAALLAVHAQTYTMQSQREVHERVLGQAPASEGGDQCGEVELF